MKRSVIVQSYDILLKAFMLSSLTLVFFSLPYNIFAQEFVGNKAGDDKSDGWLELRRKTIEEELDRLKDLRKKAIDGAIYKISRRKGKDKFFFTQLEIIAQIGRNLSPFTAV